MINQEQYSFKGMYKDVAKNKHPKEYYFDAINSRITTTDSQSSFSMINERGNSLLVDIPSITIEGNFSPTSKYKGGVIKYNNQTLPYTTNEINQQILAGTLPTTSSSQKIISFVAARDEIIIFTTDEQMDCIWVTKNLLTSNTTLELLYCRNLNFSINNPIQSIFNYENENIQKIYWVDGKNQIRHFNIKEENPINMPSTNLNFVGQVNFSQPKITGVTGGGTHTSGMIQYAYNLYRINSSQTKLSPVSELVPLDKGNLGGGEVNEVVGTTPIVKIDNIDTIYTHIKIYSVKYTSYNQIPQVSLIEERELNNVTSVTIYDDGRIISSLSLAEFLFLGSNPVVPEHIERKDSRLFAINLKDKFFDMPEEFDARAYSFPINSTSTQVVNNPTAFTDQAQGEITNITSNFNLSKKHDSLNRNYKTQKYTFNSSELGGEGKYIKYILTKLDDTLNNTFDSRNRYFKDDELYRIGIEFYNKLGQISPPKWIGDFIAPSGNLQKNYNTLQVILKPSFYTWLDSYSFESEDDKPIGYRILRANRTISDRTIISQGILGNMMVNMVNTNGQFSMPVRRAKSDENIKMPNFFVRTNQPADESMKPVQPGIHLLPMAFYNNTPGIGINVDKNNKFTEVQLGTGPMNGEMSYKVKKADTYQYNTMFQMYSPEAMFDNVNLSSGLKFSLKGGLSNAQQNFVWVRETHIEKQIAVNEVKVSNKMHPAAIGGTTSTIVGNASHVMDRGIISNTDGTTPDRIVDLIQYYRRFNIFRQPVNNSEHLIYGSPEIVERGQGVTTYNNDAKYKYTNSFEGFLTDGVSGFDEQGDIDRAIISINSYGAKNITFVLGQSPSIDSWNRPQPINLRVEAGLAHADTALLGELKRPESTFYLGNIYGGNSFEDKKRTDYVRIGDYLNIDEDTNNINSPGDTFVQLFRFLRVNKTNVERYSPGINTFSEIVEFPVETTVDLKNRNDISISGWDSSLLPSYDDYHKYNRVYSQQSNLLRTTDFDFTFKRVKDFDTRIQASQLKIPNETVDNWTDLLENETLDLDGKYGPINAVINFNDNLFTFQDEAIAVISINPRVQIVGDDGIQTELGKGAILDNYRYISTSSGTINKWSVISTSSGIYCLDLLNKSFNKITGEGITGLSDVAGFHSFFNNRLDYNVLKADNPLIKKGVSVGYNPITNDVYLTAHHPLTPFTLSFNEMTNSFVSFHNYIPSLYINKGEKFITVNPDNNALYLQNSGDYGKFYGIIYPWEITFLMNPQGRDCVFNNLEYKAETYNILNEDIKKTFDKIQASNEYQNSGVKDLVLNQNLNRKFRNWRLVIPRGGNPPVFNDTSTTPAKVLDRMRGHWMYLRLISLNENNCKMIFHEPTLYYSLYNY